MSEINLNWQTLSSTAPVADSPLHCGFLNYTIGHLYDGLYSFSASKGYKTTDGVNWTLLASPPWVGICDQIELITSLGALYVIGTHYNGSTWTKKSYYSSDGASWTEESTPSWSGRDYFSFTYVSGSQRIVMGGLNEYGSLNDVWLKYGSWTLQNASPPWSIRYNAASVYFNSKLWIMGGADFEKDVWWSSDLGVTWTEATSSAPWNRVMNATVFNNKMWVLDRDGANVFCWHSHDGSTWTKSNTLAPSAYMEFYSGVTSGIMPGESDSRVYMVGTGTYEAEEDVLSTSSSSSKSSSSISSSSISSSSISSQSSESSSSISSQSSESSSTDVSSSSSSSYSSLSSISSSSVSSSSVSSQSSSSSSSSSSYMKNADVFFASNSGLYISNFDPDKDWVRNNNLYYNKSKITFDTQDSFIWTHNTEQSNICQSYVSKDIYSNYSPVGHLDDLDVSPIDGDVFALINKEIVGFSEIFGGKITHYSNYRKKTYDASLLSGAKAYNLCGPSEITYDYIRRKIWAVDTFNNSIICINADSKQIETTINRNDILYPSSITIDVITGNVFVKAYYFEDLTEVIIIIKEQQIVSIFKTPGHFGWSDNQNPMNFFFLLNYESNNTTNLHKIDLSDGSTIITCGSYAGSFAKLTTEAINNSIISYNVRGNIEASLYDQTDIGGTSTAVNTNYSVFPCFTDASHWHFGSRSDGFYNLTRLQIRKKDNILLQNSNVIFKPPCYGSILHYERCPVVLSENNLIKISSDGQSVEKTVTLPQEFDLIETHINNEILLAMTDNNYGYIYDNNLNKTGTYAFLNNIKNIVAHHSLPKTYWVLLEGNIVQKVMLENDFVTLLGVTTIITSNECIGIRYDFNYDRVIVFSRKGIYCISETGNSVIWTREDFDYVGDISTTNNFFKLYQNHQWITRKSMKYDVLRNNLWWLSHGDKGYLCSLDMNNYSVSSFELPKNEIVFEYNSSSSSGG